LLQLLQLHELQQAGGVLNAHHVAAFYYKLGQLCHRDSRLATSTTTKQLLQHLNTLLPSVLQDIDARGLSNAVLGCACAQHMPAIALLLQAFLRPSTLAAANGFDISNVMWALGDREVRLDRP
jgi:hypothetical protein